MLKRKLTAHLPLIFLRLLSSVAGDEGGFTYDGLPYFTSTFKEICLERFDPFSCQYWDSMRYKISDSDPLSALKPKQTIEIISNGRKEFPEGDSPEEISFRIPVMDAGNSLQKRFTVFRRKAPTARGYKRGPGFRSWGGKRDSISSEQNIDKKTKFASWGGKRDTEAIPDDLILSNNEYVSDKRPKFQNWGGKREESEGTEDSGQVDKRAPFFKTREFYYNEPFKKHVPKRPQFQSWGGKRASGPWHDFFGFLYPSPRLLVNGGEKRKFSSWGGKRNEELEQNWNTNGGSDVKRHVFQNWGGKRDASDEESNRNESEIGETGKERRKRDSTTNQVVGKPKEGNPKSR